MAAQCVVSYIRGMSGTPPQSNPAAGVTAQRLHDLRAVHSDFKSVLSALLKGGYRFDDSDAPAALAQLERAVARFGDELRVLEKEWGSG